MTARLRHRPPDLSAGTCVAMDPHLFDTDLHHPPSAAAVAACGRCPVLTSCMEWAAREGEVGMVWAGEARRGRWVGTDPHLRVAVLDRTERGWPVRRIADELGVDRLVVAAIRTAAEKRRARLDCQGSKKGPNMASINKRPDGQYRARYRGPDGREHAWHFVRKNRRATLAR